MILDSEIKPITHTPKFESRPVYKKQQKKILKIY